MIGYMALCAALTKAIEVLSGQQTIFFFFETLVNSKWISLNFLLLHFRTAFR